MIRVAFNFSLCAQVNLMNRALDRVSTLLSRLEDTEQYYASTKMFRIDHPAVGNPEFQARVKCLCMWYNLTRYLGIFHVPHVPKLASVPRNA